MAGVIRTSSRRTALLGLLATALAVAAIAPGCGEKEEPESSGPPPTADTGTTGFDIIGMWEGRLTQKGIKPFKMSATIGSLDDPKLNTVHYTGIDCDGSWTYLGKRGGGVSIPRGHRRERGQGRLQGQGHRDADPDRGRAPGVRVRGRGRDGPRRSRKNRLTPRCSRWQPASRRSSPRPPRPPQRRTRCRRRTRSRAPAPPASCRPARPEPPPIAGTPPTTGSRPCASKAARDAATGTSRSSCAAPPTRSAPRPRSARRSRSASGSMPASGSRSRRAAAPGAIPRCRSPSTSRRSSPPLPPPSGSRSSPWRSPVPGTSMRLERLGVEVTDDVAANAATVALYWDADRARLAAAGFDSTTLVADVAAADRADRAAELRAAAAPGRSALPTGRETYRVMEDYTTEMKQLAEQHPDLVRPVVIGTTVEGRAIEGLEIAAGVNSPDGRPAYLQVGLIHAREWPSGELPMEFAHDLVAGFGSDPRITSMLERVRVFIVPVLNVDGFIASRSFGASPLDDDLSATEEQAAADEAAYKRKNCRPTVPGSEALPCPLRSQSGVDLNRNFGAYWGGVGSSGDVASIAYRGSGPFSEPESQALHAFSSRLQPTVVVVNHTFTDHRGVAAPAGVRRRRRGDRGRGGDEAAGRRDGRSERLGIAPRARDRRDHRGLRGLELLRAGLLRLHVRDPRGELPRQLRRIGRRRVRRRRGAPRPRRPRGLPARRRARGGGRRPFGDRGQRARPGRRCGCERRSRPRRASPG